MANTLDFKELQKITNCLAKHHILFSVTSEATQAGARYGINITQFGSLVNFAKVQEELDDFGISYNAASGFSFLHHF